MKKKKTKNQFKKGKSGNPFGRPPMTDAEKELSLKSRTHLKVIIQKYLVTSKDDLKVLVEDGSIPALDGMLIRSLVNALESGNQSELNWFLQHTVGKEKEKTNIHLSGGVESTTGINLKKLSKEELIALKDIAEKSNS